MRRYMPRQSVRPPPSLLGSIPPHSLIVDYSVVIAPAITSLADPFGAPNPITLLFV